MNSKLINVPDHHLDDELNKHLQDCNEAIFAVSFVFKSGLDLIFNELKGILLRNKKLKFYTSNYMSSTEPRALEMLLALKELGAEVYFFDSLSSGIGFHLKSYYFLKPDNSEICIVGSSNLSRNALHNSLEFNAEISDPAFADQWKRSIDNLGLNKQNKILDEEILALYKLIYDERKNPFLERSIEPLLEPEDEDYQDVYPIEAISFKEPNKAQQDALDILHAERELGLKRGLVVMATGVGKTILAALDVASFDPKRLLFVAHRKEILTQAQQAFKLFMPNKSYGWFGDGIKDKNCDFVFASIQTIGRKQNLEIFSKDHFDYIVVDEFHHAGASSYRKLVEYFEPQFFLGLTATPNRTDNIDILQFCDNNLVYKKDLLDAINLDLLCNFEYFGIHDKHVDYTKISWKGSKFDEGELETALSTAKRAEYVLENWKLRKQTRTLGFCSSIAHAEYMNDYFELNGIKTASVHSKSKFDREKAVQLLKSGELEIIFSVDLFNEGVDIPAVDTILMLRPTESKIIFLQQFGRGLRKAVGKNIVKVIDFIGNHKSFLQKPAALFDFDNNAKNIKNHINQYNLNKLSLPLGSRIFYDPQAIDFLNDLSSMNTSFVEKYEEFKEAEGHRPSASEFHNFIDKLSLVRADYGSWFEFLIAMNDCDETNTQCIKSFNKFLLSIEKTKMTKSFKMIVLQVFVNNKMQDISIDKLCKESHELLQASSLYWNELPSEFRVAENELDYSAWKKYWIKNPINALSSNDPKKKNDFKFFEIKDHKFLFKFEVTKDYRRSLILCLSEIIQYRFLSHNPRYESSNIELADLSKSPDSQLHKAISAKHDVAKLFNISGDGAKTGYYTMTGHASPPNADVQFIFITLTKSSMAIDHRYRDFFKSKDMLCWQSKSNYHQEFHRFLEIRNAKEINKPIQLFARRVNMIDSKAVPFIYCGEIEFIDVTGNNPVNVNFKLKQPLSGALEQEFLKIS